jgi:hypothetical protein
MQGDAVTVLGWIQHTAISTVIRESSWAVMGLESVHLLGLASLGGAVVIAALAALRSEGLGGVSVPAWVAGLAWMRRAGLLLMVISGALITVSMPFKYYGNAAFRWKMLLLAVVLTASWALRRLSRSVGPDADARFDAASGAIAGRDVPVTYFHGLARIVALVVLLLWIGVACCGRLIGFL